MHRSRSTVIDRAVKSVAGEPEATNILVPSRDAKQLLDPRLCAGGGPSSNTRESVKRRHVSEYLNQEKKQSSTKSVTHPRTDVLCTNPQAHLGSYPPYTQNGPPRGALVSRSPAPLLGLAALRARAAPSPRPPRAAPPAGVPADVSSVPRVLRDLLAAFTWFSMLCCAFVL